MMKKLLILMMFFGITSMASATIEIYIGADDASLAPVGAEYVMTPSDTVVIGIYNPGTGSQYGGQIDFDYYIDFYYPSEGAYSWFNGRLGPAAGDSTDFPPGLKDNSVYPLPDDYQELTIGQNWAIGSLETTGVMWMFDFNYIGDSNVYIDLWDGRDLSAPVDSLKIQVPEPMTMGLLGLGVLFLKRRK